MAQSFRSEQLSKQRVKEAYTEVSEMVQTELKQKGLSKDEVHIFLRAFKWEQKLELWVKHEDSIQFQKMKEFDFCVLSGKLGPKKKQGDMQVPEGYYHIDRFNPWSTFHLSLGINYPNAADKKRNSGNLGGDIFIHGNCVSIGCIPITDEKIKQLYIYAVEAKANGQRKIPVHIYPFRMKDDIVETVVEQLTDNELKALWLNLKKGYDSFEASNALTKIGTNASGFYVFE